MGRLVSGFFARLGLVAALAACGGGSDEPMGPDAGAPPDAAAEADAEPPPDAQARVITGVWTSRYVTPGGEVVIPDSQAGDVPVSALVPPDFARRYGDWGAGGQFSISNMPVEGIYYLNLYKRYFLRTTDTVDLSSDYLGRADATRATSSTTVAFDVTNLSAWQSTDQLQLFSAESGTVAYRLELAAVAGAPTFADTALSMLTIDLRDAAFPKLIDGDAGDEVTLAQLATTNDGTRAYQSIARTFVPAPFSVANGGSAFVEGAFADVPQTESLGFTWDVPAFDAAIRAEGLAEPLSYPRLALHTLPEASTRGLYHGSAMLLWYEPGYVEGLPAFSGTWAHGDPYPASWTRVVTAHVYTYRFLSVPDATPIPVYSRINIDVDRDSVTSGSPLEPLIGPVRNLTINSQDAYGTLGSIGTSPIVAWDPPAIGTADGYRVTVINMYDNGGATAARTTAQFETVNTRVQVPPGILGEGLYYYFRVTALATPGVDLEATPLLLTLPAGDAFTASSLATP